ncbi:MAG: DNA mismatch repair protein MutS [Anaerolineaceae bacterium]|nr:DNA mismatch repair protein MutS [Anaerolineaceae bacterium]
MTDNVTPIRRQYLDIKKQYPETIVFFRLGDFYEAFDDDAKTISRELDLVLTGRNVAKGVKVPMAGIPHHAIQNYLSRLIDKGYHVAICEQIGDQPVNGLFNRKVVRVVTPGTIVEPGLLKNEQNNYLAAMLVDENTGSIAYLDITTGEFAATQFIGEDIHNQIRAELMRLHPAEVIHPDVMQPLLPEYKINVSPLPEWRFDLNRNLEKLKSHFQVATLDGFGLKNQNLAIRTAGVLLQYLEETQANALQLLNSISVYHTHEFMMLDSTTRRNLELTETMRDGQARGSLLYILDQTVSPMGKRLLRQWVSKPLLDIDRINQRQDAVEYFVEHGIQRSELREHFKQFSDLERLINRVISEHANPKDLATLRSNLKFIPSIKNEFTNTSPILDKLFSQLDPCSDTVDLLDQSIADDPPASLQNTGIINPGYSDELDQIINSSKYARQWIAALEAVERERTGIKTLKVGYNKVFGYYIEISKGQVDNAPENYIRKQTLVNAERYITPEMKEYETTVLNAEERIHEIEQRLFKQICKTISAAAERILKSARIIAHLDAISSLAETAVHNDFIRPQLVEGTELLIQDGRHPVVEVLQQQNRYVPNDTIFADEESIRIITGPNMSGKSTFLRQVAIIVLMAQMGSFVPARSAKIGLVDRIFTRIGAQDEIHAGQSTFMVEMVETANILNHATNSSLLILDEIGRGTSTYDGLSIAWSVIEYIHNHPRLRARTLFATHYHELTQLSELLPAVRNFNVAVTEGDGTVIFLHKIIPGSADKSYGIHVAQLAGMPAQVIERANTILSDLESSSGTVIKATPLGVSTQQMKLFPETNPLLDELKALDINALTPLDAINQLFEWKSRYKDS